MMIERIIKKIWKNQDLLKFQCHCGGDMNGNSNSVILSDRGDCALLTFSDAKRFDEEPVVKEYLLDRKILDEVKTVFLKYRMFSWEGRKFTNLFVADGETTSYTFIFSKNDIHFSSQIFPAPYGKKLKELHTIIDRYLKLADAPQGEE